MIKQKYTLEDLKELLTKSGFSTTKWTDIKFEDQKGAPGFVVTSYNNLRIKEATLDELSLIIHLRDDLNFLIRVMTDLRKGTHSCEEIINSKDFQYIQRRNEFVRSGRWKSYIEGRDHQGGDSMIHIGTDSKTEGNIYIYPLLADDQDFICAARNYLSFFVSCIEDKCGTKRLKISKKNG